MASFFPSGNGGGKFEPRDRPNPGPIAASDTQPVPNEYHPGLGRPRDCLGLPGQSLAWKRPPRQIESQGHDQRRRVVPIQADQIGMTAISFNCGPMPSHVPHIAMLDKKEYIGFNEGG